MSGTAKLTEEQMIANLWDMVAQMRSQKKVAESLHITQSYLSDILHGDRAVSESLAKKIGYIKKIYFEAE